MSADYLLDAILNHDDITSSSTLLTFGTHEFDMMRLWSSGTVYDSNIVDAPTDSGSTKVSKLEVYDDLDEDIHPISDDVLHESRSINGCSNNINVTKVVEALHLKCGVQGLGRACQRLIDYGRCEYLRHVIFNDHENDTTTSAATTASSNNIQSKSENSNSSSGNTVELVYYVPESVTPQNALLIAYRS